jgi:hypothetical protein
MSNKNVFSMQLLLSLQDRVQLFDSPPKKSQPARSYPLDCLPDEIVEKVFESCELVHWDQLLHHLTPPGKTGKEGGHGKRISFAFNFALIITVH